MQIAEIPLKGVTREMADNVSANGELEMAVNVVNDGQGLEMAEAPQAIFALSAGESLLLIHKGSTYWHYITQQNTNLYYVYANAETGTIAYEEVANPSGNPATLGYYELSNGTYVATTDTSVASGKKYYYPLGTRQLITTISGTITTSQVIGNTVIYNDDDGIHYLLWKENAYIDLGQKPPMVSIQFGLESEFVISPYDESNIPDPVDITDKPYADEVALPWFTTDSNTSWIPPKDLLAARIAELKSDPLLANGVNEDFNETTYSLENRLSTSDRSEAATNNTINKMSNGVFAEINKFVAKQAEDNKFVFPFFVRYAYEMFDGTYIMHSYPVLMIPNSRGPVFALDGAKGLGLELIDRTDPYDKIRYHFRGRAYGFSSTLKWWSESYDTQLNDWKDLIKNVSVFVTMPAYNYDQSGKVFGWTNMDGATSEIHSQWNSYYSISKMANDNSSAYDVQKFSDQFVACVSMNDDASDSVYFHQWDDDHELPSYIMTLPEFSESEVRKKLVENGVFFRIASFTLDELAAGCPYAGTAMPIEKGIVKTLTTQPQLVDDFYTHDKITAGVSNIYNRRLNLTEYERTPHNALPSNVEWARHEADDETYFWDMRVFIKDKDGDIVVPMTEPEALGCKKYDNYIIPFMYGQDEDGSIKTPQSGDYWLKVYNITPGTPVKVTMNNQVGYVTTAAFMSGSIPEDGSGGIDLDGTLPTVLQTIIHENFAPPEHQPGNGSVEAIAPANTTLLVITENKLSSVDAYNLWIQRNSGKLPKYIFYPNPDAYMVQLRRTKIADSSKVCYKVPLIKHTALNGAYWMADLYKATIPTEVTIITNFASPNVHPIRYPGEIITSEAENPFTFLPRNVNKIGEGTIRSLCAAVAPLSEGQFGQFPLYAFTTEGVWALTIGTTGEAVSIQPVTRDVILNGTTPLSLDQSVVFMTSRGVLQLAGRHTKELSKVLAGKYYNRLSSQMGSLLSHELNVNDDLIDLPDIIAADKIAAPALFAYDYLNSRIYVTPIGKSYSWVYNLKSGLWTQSQTHVTAMVNSYPECIFTQDGNAVRLSDDVFYDKGIILTRPLKLAKQGFQKLRELALRGYTSPDDMVTMLCGTRNWRDYGVVRASQGARLSRLGGSPYNAHVIAALVNGDDEAVITHVSTTYDIEQNNRLR